MRGTLVPKQDKGLKAFNRVDQQIVASVNAIESQSIILAKALREMAVEQKDGKPLWSAGGFSSLKHYCEDRAIGRRQFHYLLTAGEIVSKIESQDGQDMHHMVQPQNARQIRPMSSLVSKEPDAIPTVWDYAIEAAKLDEQERPEAKHVQEAMREYNARDGKLQSCRKFSDRESKLKTDSENGLTVVANINTDSALISWAEARGKYVYVGRGSKWGNPFKMPDDGDRETVCECYRKHYVPNKTSILSDLDSLVGMVQGVLLLTAAMSRRNACVTCKQGGPLICAKTT